MKPLTREQFRDAIQKGLGRVVMHLREYGPGDFKDDILNACTHHLAYDAQCEGTRTDWLISIIDLTGEEEFYCERILKALSESTEYWEVDQLVELAGVFAKRGCVEARNVIRDKFDRRQFRENILFAKTIFDFDGLDGLLHLANVIGKELEDERDDYEILWIYEMACDHFGKETVRAELSKQTYVNENVRRFVESFDQLEKEEAERKKAKQEKKGQRVPERPRPDGLTYEGILNGIENKEGTYPGRYGYFGRRFANLSELEQLFERLIAETRRDQLLRCLWVFRSKELPRLDKKIFEIAASDDKELQDAAINALANSKDASIRDLAIQLIREDKEVVCRSVIRLFEKNYQQGDHRIIETALFVPENSDVLHWLTFEILDLCEANMLPELSQCLLWVYEQTPCSNCRDRAVECLIKMNCLPDAVREECQWDCRDEIRELVKGML